MSFFITGDWNAKVGSQEITGVTGNFGVWIQNEGRKRLIEFCQKNTLVIANTLCQQHKTRLYTWASSDGQYPNQTDYILCSQRWRSPIRPAKNKSRSWLWFRLLENSDLNWRKYPLEEGIATDSNILAWRIPWAEEPGGLESVGSQRIGHDWVTVCAHKARDERCPPAGGGGWSGQEATAAGSDDPETAGWANMAGVQGGSPQYSRGHTANPFEFGIWFWHFSVPWFWINEPVSLFADL